MHKLTEDFHKNIALYDDYRNKIEVLIRELFKDAELDIHKIESRVKDAGSLDSKIIRKNEKYTQLSEITDLVGIRVITYLENDVDNVAQILQNEFEYDEQNSIDKRKSEMDRFGYKSLHYVLSLKNERKSLPEYKRFKDVKFEVQIRSILQHAWAEIEHDIGYKGEIAVPDIVKRNFYRVAALLETADLEFVNIKRSLKEYQENIQESIKQSPEEVELNAVSLESFILNDALVETLDSGLVEAVHVGLNDDTLVTLEHLNFLQIKTIKQLKDLLIKYKEIIIPFAKNWLTSGVITDFSRGICIFYLCYVLVAERNDIDFAISYFEKAIFQSPTTQNKLSANELLEKYHKTKEDLL